MISIITHKKSKFDRWNVRCSLFRDLDSKHECLMEKKKQKCNSWFFLGQINILKINSLLSAVCEASSVKTCCSVQCPMSRGYRGTVRTEVGWPEIFKELFLHQKNYCGGWNTRNGYFENDGHWHWNKYTVQYQHKMDVLHNMYFYRNFNIFDVGALGMFRDMRVSCFVFRGRY